MTISRLLTTILFAAALLVTAPLATAAQKVILWRIERPGVAPSHLVAPTAGEEAGPIPADVESLLTRARSLVVEMDLDPAALLPALPATLEANPNHRAIAVDPQLYRRALALLRAHGISGEQVSRLRPWALGLALNPPPARGEPLELQLLHRTAANRKNVRALETLAEAITDLDAISLRDQEAMIRAGLARGDKAPIVLEELLKAWRAKDGPRMQQLMQATRNQLEPYRTEAHETRLAGRLAKQLTEGDVLVVTSSADAQPQSGLIRRLRERGWNLIPIRSTD